MVELLEQATESPPKVGWRYGNMSVYVGVRAARGKTVNDRRSRLKCAEGRRGVILKVGRRV